VPEEEPRRRNLVLRLAGTLALALVVFLAIPAWVLTPFFLDDRRLDGIVRVVALDWRDFGEERARARLEAELDERGVGSQVRDESCTFATEGGDRVVQCAWTVFVEVPLLARTYPLSFASVARITEGGDLR
jgi:hypothetical protein